MLFTKGDRLYVPKWGNLRRVILKECPNSKWVGHPRIMRTLALVEGTYYWPRMGDDVETFMRTSLIFQQDKIEQQKSGGLLEPLPTPKGPWKSVSMDFITCLPKSEGGGSIIVVVDRFSKYGTFIAAPPDVTADDTAKIFFKNVIMGTDLNFSTSFHPQTDGKTGRVNALLELYLWHYVSANQHDWAKLPDVAQFSYNMQRSEATGKSPFELVMGRQPFTLNALAASYEGSSPAAYKTMKEWHEQVELARASLDNTANKMKKWADERRRRVEFEVRDQVMVKLLPQQFKSPRKVLELIIEDGSGCGLHLNIDKIKVFWPKEDPRSRLAGIFPPNIARPLHGVKLLSGPARVDFDFCNELVMKRVAKTIELMDAIAKINDPQCELLLLCSCTGISRLYSTTRTCPPRVFESAQQTFDVALRSSLECIVTASGPGFGDWQWRLTTLPLAFGGLGVYSAGDVLNYAFLASRLQSAGLQSKLLRHTGIVSPRPIFDDALPVFNTSMEIGLLSNPSEIVAPKLMKKMADIYFTRVTKNAESTFSLSPRQMALWTSQREDHTSDWLRTVPISGLGQTMNGKTYRCVLCYRLGIPLFSVSKPCSACSRVFAGDIYGDHAVSCAGIIGIKHRHNVVRDTLVDICYRSGISAGLDVCVDLTGSSPLTQTGMVDFVPELEADAVTLFKRIRKFFMAHDIGARAAVHIFNRISFAIAKGVGAQIVYRLPSNFL
ncbi:RNA-directed DNA polymerase, eukaryota [Tanacetum coccineum]